MAQPAELTRLSASELARLGLTDEEKERYRRQLGSILGYVAQLNEVDAGAASGSTPVLALEDVMGDDEPRPSLDPGDVLANAPAQESGHFRVPAVLDEQ